MEMNVCLCSDLSNMCSTFRHNVYSLCRDKLCYYYYLLILDIDHFVFPIVKPSLRQFHSTNALRLNLTVMVAHWNNEPTPVSCLMILYGMSKQKNYWTWNITVHLCTW